MTLVTVTAMSKKKKVKKAEVIFCNFFFFLENHNKPLKHSVSMH